LGKFRGKEDVATTTAVKGNDNNYIKEK